ncbi:MAG: hypothetical protein JNN15_06160 [Blastocatellia bacterium]|nr:hypothetical protein [Blastocatellia bacterium]
MSKEAINFYKHVDEIKALVNAFEDCSLPRTSWTHLAHLTVGLWYLFHYSMEDATKLIRSGIQKYNNCQSIVTTPQTGYHETITLFWIWAVKKHISSHNESTSLLTLANGLTNLCDKNLPFNYYTKDLLISWEARTSWKAPDIKPLD